MVTKRAREKTPGSPATPGTGGRKKVAKTLEPSASPLVSEGLEGRKIVITGETEILSRSIFESRLRDAGAVVTTAVSGVTNMLIYGPKLEDGRPTEMSTKFKKAEELISSGKSKVGLRLLSEADFFKEYPELSPSASIKTRDATSGQKAEPSNPKSTVWAERWRPVQEEDFGVNHAAFSALRDWLKRWTPSLESERACLLTGPPGLGKTSSAIAVCKLEGFELLEMNASDTRSKKRLKDLYPLIWGGCTLNKGALNAKLCLLMDEADGLSAGDRGGADEMCRLIRMSRVPIVATCNDKQHPKVKTLAKYCRVIDFSKPDPAAAVARGLEVARAEGCTAVDEAFVQRCFAAGNGDMRSLMNALQAFAQGQKQISGGTDLATYEDVFAIARKLVMNANSQPRSVLMNYFFFDYDMVPLIIQENCPKSLARNKNELQALKQLSIMTDSICYADKIMSRVRERNQWELLPDAGLFSSVIPAQCANPHGMFRMDFPGILGRISSRNKRRRQQADIQGRTGYTDGITDGLFELLGDWLFQPLGKSENFDEFFARCDAYHLDSKELTTDTLMNVRHKLSPSPYDGINSKVKTKLTKAFAARDIVTSKKRGKQAAAPPTTTTASSDSEDMVEEDDIVEDAGY